MNLFGHWVPSLLHFKAGRQAAFLLSRKILKSNASAISHHRNVCVSACGRICSQHKAACPSCTSHWETEEKYPYGFSHVTSSLISSNFFFFLHSSISWWEWGCAERAVPTHEHVSDRASMQHWFRLWNYLKEKNSLDAHLFPRSIWDVCVVKQNII